MKVNVYTIYDVVAKECGPIFQAKNHDVAIRGFRSLISDNPNVDVSDYNLYCLGEFDNEKCSFVPLSVPFDIPVDYVSSEDFNENEELSLFDEVKK